MNSHKILFPPFVYRIQRKIERYFEPFPLGLACCLFALAVICAVFSQWFWFAITLAMGLSTVWMSWQMARDARGQ